jgi:predicted ATPase
VPRALSPQRAARHNLPAQLTSFVGRDQEMCDVTSLVSAHRLVALTGSGGCGKSRLALQVATRFLDQFPDGVWLVELAPLADPNLVARTVAAAVDVQERPDRPLHDTLVDSLRSRSLLLILDNCEHLIEACTRLADALLRGCPDVQILATSREALGVAEEVAWRVPSLRTPTAHAQLTEALEILAEIGDQIGIALIVEFHVSLAAAQSRWHRALRLGGAASIVRRQGGPVTLGAQDRLEQALARARDALGEQDATATWIEGRSMTVDQAVALAVSVEFKDW